MANKKKNYWYVLVLSAKGGPTFVTAVHHANKTAEWNKKEPPLEMEMFWAKDLALGLLLNFTTALPVCSPIQLTDHMFNYNKGHFEWQWDEEEKSPDAEKDGDK